MEIVSVKFQKDILKNIDTAIKKHNFNSRTEFLREAVRKQLADLNRDELAEEFIKRFYGKGKPKNNKSDRQIREEAFAEYLKEKGWKI